MTREPTEIELRVADALDLCEARHSSSGQSTKALLGNRHPPYRLAMARAAIRAMRGPTDDMCEAGAKLWIGGQESEAHATWVAMIDAALPRSA